MRKKTVKYWLVFVLALVIIAGISSCMPSSTAGNLNIEVNISNGASITVDKVPYTYELKVKVSYDRAKTVLLIVYVNNEQSGSLKIPVGEDYTVPVVFKNFGIVNLKITVQGVGDDRKDITKSVFINRKPEVSLSSPDNSQSFEGGYISFTWVATDTKDDALTSYIDIGDGNWIKVSEEKKITSNDGIFTTYIYSYKAERIHGDYTWKVKVVDSHKVEIVSGTRTYKVKNRSPSVKITSPANGEEVLHGKVALEVEVNDPDGDYPVTVELYHSNDNRNYVKVSEKTTSDGGNLSFDINVDSNKNYFWYAKATDSYNKNRMSNTSSIVSISVKENQPPQFVEVDIDGKDITNFLNDGTEMTVGRGERVIRIKAIDPEGDYPLKVVIYEKEGEEWIKEASGNLEDPDDEYRYEKEFIAGKKYSYKIELSDSYNMEPAVLDPGELVMNVPENLAPEVRILEPDSDNILSSGSYTLKLSVNDPEGDYPVTLEVFQSTDNTNFTQIYSGEVSGGEIDITTSVRAGYDYYWTVVATDSYSCGEKSATSSVHVSVSPELDLGESTMVDVDGIYKIYAHYSGLKGFEIKVRGQNVEADDIEVAEFDNVGCDILSNTIGDMVIKSVMLDEAIGVYGKLAQIDSNGKDIDVSYSALRFEDMEINTAPVLIGEKVKWDECNNCSKYDVYISDDINLVENLNKEALIKADTADSSIIFYVPSAGTYYIRVVGKSGDGNDKVVSNIKSFYFEKFGEDFESGEMPSYFDYTGRWQVVSDQAHSGSYSIKTWSNCYEYVDSSMEVEVNIPYDAIVEFWVRVYNNYHDGRFQFYVDGEKKYDYDMYNKRTDWFVVRVPVSSGSHILKWFVDDQDYYDNFSLWIDDIVIKPAKVEWNGHTYYMPPYAKYWYDAKASAENHGGHLVIIESAEEQEFIENYYLGGYNIWIGLTDEEQEGVWKWVDGRLLSDTGYSHWNSGEPNNSGDEDYAHMWGSSGYWNDYKNYGNFYFIIEYDDGN